MSFVDQQHGLVAPTEGGDVAERGLVAVHAEDALGYHQLPPLWWGVAEQVLQPVFPEVPQHRDELIAVLGFALFEKRLAPGEGPSISGFLSE